MNTLRHVKFLHLAVAERGPPPPYSVIVAVSAWVCWPLVSSSSVSSALVGLRRIAETKTTPFAACSFLSACPQCQNSACAGGRRRPIAIACMGPVVRLPAPHTHAHS